MKNFLYLSLFFVLSFTACAQSNKPYPAQDIQLVVNAQAGSGTDSVNRQIALFVEKELGGKIYLVNKPGAADATGPNSVMDSKPDGYTMGNLNYGSVVNAVWENLIPGYDIAKLKVFAMVSQENDALIVGKNSPYKTFNDLIVAAKANPGKIRIGDQGIGSRVYLLTLRLEGKYGVSFNKISYKSSAAQREAILNNEIDGAITSLGDFSSLLNSGDSIGLIEFSAERNISYPSVPTAVELGLGNEFVSSSFIAMAVPAKTPQAIVDTLSVAFEKAVESQEFQDWTKSIGIKGIFMGGAELETFISDLQKQEFSILDQLKKDGLLQ